MSQTYALPATKRDLAVKPRDLRTARQIPAVCYGVGKDNEHLQLDYQTFRKILKNAGESSLIDLVIGDEAVQKVLVHKVDYDPLTDEFQHVDFLRIDMNKKITTKVPLKFVGISPAVKDLGGMLTHNKNEISIKCLPGDLIHDIEVDISVLTELHGHLKVADLQIDRNKAEVIDGEDVLVCSVLPPKTAEQIEAEEAEDVGEAVSEEVKAESEEEKTAAAASKESDSEKKGSEKKD